KSVHVAAAWTRDGRDWQFAHGLSAEQIRARDEVLRKQDYLPLDVAGYLVDSGNGQPAERYAALWGKKVKQPPPKKAPINPQAEEEPDESTPAPKANGEPSGFDAVLYVGLSSDAYLERLTKDNLRIPRTQFALEVNGQPRIGAVWLKQSKDAGQLGV